MKHKIIYSSLVGIIIILVILNFIPRKVETLEDDNTKQVVEENTLSMMIEQTAGAGDYELETRSNWPTSGYTFNTTLSKCENGGELSWDDAKKTVVMMGAGADKCYVYFDIYDPPIFAEYIIGLYKTQGANGLYHHDGTLINGISDGSYRYAGGEYQLTSMATNIGLTVLYADSDNYSSSTNGIINSYCNGSKSYVKQGCSSNQYYTLQYDSASTLYSFYYEAAEKAVLDGYLKKGVNNYVCFGSTVTTCPIDNLYRIIGVFDGQVKLIKADYANSKLLGTDGDYYSGGTYNKIRYSGFTGSFDAVNTYYWNHSTYNNVWSQSKLNTVNLNTNYLNNIGTTWSNKIATTTWKVAGNTSDNIYNVVAKTAYANEITSPSASTTYDAKIGLMYVSDYGFAANPIAWATILKYYYKSVNGTPITSLNWMWLGFDELTISPNTKSSKGIYSARLHGGRSF